MYTYIYRHTALGKRRTVLAEADSKDQLLEQIKRLSKANNADIFFVLNKKQLRSTKPILDDEEYDYLESVIGSKKLNLRINDSLTLKEVSEIEYTPIGLVKIFHKKGSCLVPLEGIQII